MSKNKNVNKINKQNVNEGPVVHVEFNTDMSHIEVKNAKDINDFVYEPFRGEQYSYYQKSFSRRHLNYIKKSIIKKYVAKNPEISKKDLRKISKLIDKNVNLNVYSALRKYDNANYWKKVESNKANKYLQIMTKNIKRKRNESKKDYKNRVALQRNKALYKAGIICDFNLDGIANSYVNPFDKIRLLKMAAKFKSVSNIFYKGKNYGTKFYSESEKKQNIERSNQTNLRDSKVKANYFDLTHNNSQRKYTAPKGLTNTLRKISRAKDFKKRTIKALVAAGIASLGILTVAGNPNTKSISSESYIKNNSDIVYSINEDSYEHIQPQDTICTLDINSQANKHIEHTKYYDATISEQVKQEKQNNKSDIQTNIQSETKMMTLKDVLLENIDIPFDLSFKGPETGKYYSSPKGTGNYGRYDNKKDNLHIVYLDVFDVDGSFHVYKMEDGKSISEIKELHPDAKFSYCVFTDGGMNLGWNPSDDNDIETCILKGAIANLKQYLSPEAMQFLCENNLQDKIDLNNENVKEIINLISQASKEEQDNRAINQEANNLER